MRRCTGPVSCLPFGVVEKSNGLYIGGEPCLSNVPGHPAGTASFINQSIQSLLDFRLAQTIATVITTLEWRSRARARATSCFWPAERGAPPSERTRSRPSGDASTVSARCARLFWQPHANNQVMTVSSEMAVNCGGLDSSSTSTVTLIISNSSPNQASTRAAQDLRPRAAAYGYKLWLQSKQILMNEADQSLTTTLSTITQHEAPIKASMNAPQSAALILTKKVFLSSTHSCSTRKASAVLRTAAESSPAHASIP